MPELCRICVSSFVQPVMAWEATIQDLQTRLREATESQFHFFRKKTFELMWIDDVWQTTRHHFFGLRNRNKSECRPRMLPRTAVIFLIPMRLTCGSLGSESSQTFAVLLVLASVPTIDEHIYIYDMYIIIHIYEHLHIYGCIYMYMNVYTYICIHIYLVWVVLQTVDGRNPANHLGCIRSFLDFAIHLWYVWTCTRCTSDVLVSKGSVALQVVDLL